MATTGPHTVTFAFMVVAGFLVGSVPFSLWMGRLGGVRDVRRHGSRNPGAANVWKSAGRLLGVATGALDAGKGAAVVWLSWRLGLPDEVAVWSGAAAVVGHDYSPWLGWRGGKGGATTAGMLACFLFPELLIVLLLWLAWCAIDPRRKFLGSIAAVSMTPILATMSGRLFPDAPFLPPARPWSVVIASALLVVLLWVRVAPGLKSGTGS